LANKIPSSNDSNNNRDLRKKVKYISASAASGKTASVLAAFLDMKNGGDVVYLYIAFSNNGSRHFTWEEYSPNCKQPKAEIQDAALFISECVKQLFPNDLSKYLLKNTYQDLIDPSSGRCNTERPAKLYQLEAWTKCANLVSC
jgi:hypothetical protein